MNTIRNGSVMIVHDGKNVSLRFYSDEEAAANAQRNLKNLQAEADKLGMSLSNNSKNSKSLSEIVEAQALQISLLAGRLAALESSFVSQNFSPPSIDFSHL